MITNIKVLNTMIYKKQSGFRTPSTGRLDVSTSPHKGGEKRSFFLPPLSCGEGPGERCGYGTTKITRKPTPKPMEAGDKPTYR
jgi:hypothetical protein